MTWLEKINPSLNDFWQGPWRPGFVESTRYLYDHELVCVLEGGCDVVIRDESWSLSAGEYIIVPPDAAHRSKAHGGGVVRSCVHFDWRGKPKAPRDGVWRYHPQRPRRQQVVETPDFVPADILRGAFDLTGPVPEQLSKVEKRWQQSRDQKFLYRGLLIELLTQLSGALSVESTATPKPVNIAYAAKELLDYRAFEATDSIQELMASLGFSYEHVARLFRREFGKTPVAYFNARKLERARMLLAIPSCSVKEAAHGSGFADVSYFVRLFRRQFGQAPSSYRQGADLI